MQLSNFVLFIGEIHNNSSSYTRFNIVACACLIVTVVNMPELLFTFLFVAICTCCFMTMHALDMYRFIKILYINGECANKT